jgi:hypothetical protein
VVAVAEAELREADSGIGSGLAAVGSGGVAASEGGAGIKSKIEPEFEYGMLGVKPPGLNLSPLCARVSQGAKAAATARMSAADRVMRNICATTNSA